MASISDSYVSSVAVATTPMEEAAAASPTAPAAATAAAVAAAVAADVTPGDEEIPLQGMGIG